MAKKPAAATSIPTAGPVPATDLSPAERVIKGPTAPAPPPPDPGPAQPPPADAPWRPQIIWALGRVGLDGTNADVIRVLSEQYPHTNWASQPSKTRINNTRSQVKKKASAKAPAKKVIRTTRTVASSPAPATPAPAPRPVGIASTVAQVQTLASKIGWEELQHLVTLLRPRG